MEWRTSALCILLLALTCGTLVNAKRVYASNHVNTICSMWGNFHFTTFDGETYQFKGTCEYNLVSDCHSLIRQFSVYVKRTQDPKDSKISRLSVTINDIAVVMTEDLVTVNEQNVTLPIHVAGILVEKNAIYTKLYSKIGISVMWNRDDSVLVELDSKYSGHTCGLCGDFNGIALNDEFIHSGRKLGYVEFGNMHRVHDPSHYCEDPFEEVEEQNAVGRCEEHQEICEDILENKDWSSCSWVLSPLPYIKACANDVCNRQPGETNTTSLCSTLSEYSRQCSHAGGTPPNWRTSNFCSVKCPYNMVYSESGSPCMDTCSHRDTNTLCEEHKVDGCFCPPGTVFDDISNTGCIPLKQCQCKHDHVYNAGEVLQQEGEECVCEGGNWICKSLPSPGLCAVEEGSHFTTYDGKEFTFHGDCNYLLSKDCEGSKFIILGKIVPCINLETDTCLKSIVVLIDNDKKNPLIIKADGTVQHNAEVLLPYTTADFTVFRPSSFHIMFQTAFGLQVQVQLVPLMQVYITVDQSFQGKTCGLCGNFNKVLSDDLKTPQGMVEGTATSFANAWKVQSNCPDRKERMDDPCSYSTNSEHFAEHWCSKMKDKESLFAKCHTSVNPDSYYKRCKYSSCSCEKSEECLCAVFSSYARACAAKGIFLQGWRHLVCEKYTENCPASQNYSYQLQSCQSTCQSLSSERQDCSDDFVPVDGCACPKGLYQDEKGVCVPMEKCPCYNNGLKVQPGRSVSIKDEHCVCMNGKLHCRSWKPRFLDCSSPKVYFNCSTAGQNENGLECAQTCLQQNVDCFSLECESGCQCPTGLLDDGRGNCVTPHNCPCSHNGQFYAPGAQITMDCNKCTCQHGTWKCTEHSCPGICTIYGSGHYQTFDEQRFGFRGDCSYIAVQDKCGNKTGQFSVVTENIPCGTTGTTCSKAVDIFLGRTRLDLSDDKVTATDTGVGPLIKYNERKVGMYIVIDAENGLTVLWDRITTVRIILQPQHSGQVCGLCGNFNGDGKDDLTTQGNLQTTNILEFVDSWKAASNCPDSELDIDPCVATPNRHTWAKIQCSIIKEDTFKDCHSKVDPNPYYENCVKDSCACDTGGDCECFCTAVAAYAQACNEADVCVVWRTPEICPVYCDYYNNPGDCTWHYSPCHTPCYKTCLNPEGICNNTLPNLEGCYPKCPEDKPIFDEKNQICVEACNGTCYINGTEFNPGEEIPTEEPCQICICDENGKIQCFQKPRCCYYNGTEYGDNEIIYNVTDGMGMCYYAICINTTVIETQEPCKPSPTPPENTPTTTITVSTESTTPSQPPTVSTSSPTPTKITTTSTGTPETMSPCVDICEWSEWFNVYNPVTGGGNDFETYENITESGKKICEHPEDIECRAVNQPDISFEEFVNSTKQVVQCNVSYGLQCEKKQQNVRPYKCFDYEIRVLCCFPCSTPSPTTTPTSTFSTTQTPLGSTSRPSTTSSQTPKPPTVSTSSPTPTEIPTTTPPSSTPTTKMTQSTTMEGSTTSSQTPKPPTVSTSSPTPTEITTTTTTTPPSSTPTTKMTQSTTMVESTTSSQTPKPPTVSTSSPTPTEITTITTTRTPPSSTPTTKMTQSTTMEGSTTSSQTPKPPTVSTSSPTPTEITTITTTRTPPSSTPTTKMTQSTTMEGSTTSSQTPKPPTVSTSSPTPTEITTTTTTTPPSSTPTTKMTQSTTMEGSTTSSQTPKPPTVSTSSPTPTEITTTTTTTTPPSSTPTTKMTQSTTMEGSTTSSQTPKPPTVSTSSPTPTEITTTTTPPSSTPTTKMTQSTTMEGSTTSSQTPKPPTVSTSSPTPTEITTITTTRTPPSSTPTTKMTQSTTMEGSTTSSQTPKPPTVSTSSPTPTEITTTTTTTPPSSTPTTKMTQSTTMEGSTTSSQTPKPPTVSTSSPTPTEITTTTTTTTPPSSTPTTKMTQSTTMEGSTTSSQTPKPPTVSTSSPTPTEITTITTTRTPPSSTPTTKMTQSTTMEGSTTSSQTPKPPTVSTSSPTPTKITTTSSGTPETMSPCVDICEWSEWFNVYNPVTGGGNDFETYENITETGKKICEHPEDIECRAVNQPDISFEEFVNSTKQVVQCNVSYGLQCEKKNQNVRPYKCFDYEIRVLCCFPCSTPSPTTTPTSTFSTTQTPFSSTSRPSTTSSQTPKPPTVSTYSPTPTEITTTTGTPPGTTQTTKIVESTTETVTTLSVSTKSSSIPTFSIITGPTITPRPQITGSTTTKPTTTKPLVTTESTTAIVSPTSSQTPKSPTVSTSSHTPTTSTTGIPTGSTTTTKLTQSTTGVGSTTSSQTPKPPTVSTSPTPTERTTTTGTPPGSTPTTEVTQSTTVSTTSPQTPKPPTVSTTPPTPTKTTTGIPTGSTTTTKLTQSTTGVGSTTSSQTPKPPTVSTSPTPTERTTTTQTPPGSTPTTEVTQSTTVSTTSPQTPKPPTVSTTPPTPTKTTTGIPTGSTTTTKLTQSTTGVGSTTSSQTPKPPTVSTSPTPTERTTTTQTPPGTTPTTEVTQSTTVSTTSPQTPKPPTVSTTSPTPTIITTTTTTTGTPTVSSTRPGSTTPTASTKPLTTTIKTTLSTTTRPSTTLCFCEFNGTQYELGETILDNVHLGSGICLTMVCSDICVIQNTTNPCPTSPTPTPTPYYDCPEWDKNTNETFIICNCTMARCIEDNIIEIIPYECPPLQNITCANGKNPVLVYDEHYCCQHYACDCFCEGWGDPHYITFDGTFYSYQGNCTYTLMEEIRPHYHLKIYIDNVYCDPIEHVSCPRSIIVSYNNLIITLTNHNLFGGAELEASINNEKLRLPFSRNAVRVVSSSLDLFLEIPQLGVIVTFGATGFSINLPFQHFGNNTQGHCGTCNNNRADDCMLPGGILVSDCAVMADYWPANLKNGEICTKPTVLPTVGTSPKPTPSNCQALPECNLLHSKLFEQCHHYVSPDNFFLGCHYDSCHMSNPAVVCTSLQTYARTCSQFGLCINWRNYTSLCNIECPTNKIFKPCGPAEPQTCEDQPEERSLEIPTEGCFCPDGMMLFNKVSDVCVEKCGCLDASETPREFGEVFEYNCEVCVCERATKSINCKPKQCLDSVPESCTLPGLVLVNVTDPSDPCCTKQVCNCDTSTCPSLKNVCEIGYSSELEVPEGKCCPEIICVPKKVCVFDNKEYEPGTPIPVVNCQECTCTREVDPKTQLFKISCKMVTCNKVCNPGYEYQEPVSYKDCCGKCVQTHCIINVNGTQHILKEGDVLPTTDRDCDRITCTKVNGQFITDNYRVQCPAFNISNCQPGTVQLMADGCCYFCVDKIKGCQVQVVQDYIVHDGCQSENKIDLTFCEGDCGSYSRYTEPKLSACSCCQATNISNRTVSLGCPSGAKIHHTYIHVNECTCSKTACHETGFNQHKLENSRKKRSFQLT